MKTVCKAGELGFRSKPLIDAGIRVIHVAGKEDGNGFLRTEVEVRVLAVAELEGIRRTMMRHFQDSSFGKAKTPILPDRSFPVFLQAISPKKDNCSAVFQSQNGGKCIGVRDAFSLAACDVLVGGSETVLLTFFRPKEVNPDAGNFGGFKIGSQIVMGQLTLTRMAINLGQESAPFSLKLRHCLANRRSVIRDLPRFSKYEDIYRRERVPERANVRMIAKD